jgi:phosphoketolase
MFLTHTHMNRDISVGIATRYVLDGPGIESWWGRGFRTRPDRTWVLPSLLYNGYRVFLGAKAAGAWR